jgi:hypothetical protein
LSSGNTRKRRDSDDCRNDSNNINAGNSRKYSKCRNASKSIVGAEIHKTFLAKINFIRIKDKTT